MDKIEKAQKELEASLEAARLAAESSLNEKMDKSEELKNLQMEDMLRKIKEHQEHVETVRNNQEEKLKPYVEELQVNIKAKEERARYVGLERDFLKNIKHPPLQGNSGDQGSRDEEQAGGGEQEGGGGPPQQEAAAAGGREPDQRVGLSVRRSRQPWKLSPGICDYCCKDFNINNPWPSSGRNPLMVY
jgi:hypothetical protein